jgi:hypothetical protein
MSAYRIAVGMLDLNHLGSVVTQKHRGDGSGKESRRVDYADSGQRLCRHFEGIPLCTPEKSEQNGGAIRISWLAQEHDDPKRATWLHV